MEACKENGNCSVCDKETTKTCGQCRKVFYCSREHQVAHRKEHRDNCYPGEIKYDCKLGYHLVATRFIRKGEWILKEKPLFLAPNGNLKNLKKICLGCCDIVKDCNTCLVCNWPVCNKVCQNAAQHAKFECKILADNNIPKPKEPFEFEYVGIIRCILIKKEKPEKWEKMLTLLPDEDVKCPVNGIQLHNSDKDILRFLTRTCNMEGVDIDTVTTICSLLNKCLYLPGRLANRIGAQLYYKAGKIATECVPNVRVFDEEPNRVGGRDKSQRKPLYQVKVLATSDIQNGEMFKQFFCDSVLGTLERRAFLKDEFRFDCFCGRCLDPTELGTYISAIKCTSDKCRGVSSKDPNLGYYLPVDPTNEDSSWRCNRCQEEVPYLDHVYDIITAVSDEATLTIRDIRKYNDMPNGSGLLTVIRRLDCMIKAHSGITAHSNHYMLIPLKVQFLSQMYNFLATVDCEGHLYATFAFRMIDLASEVLSVIGTIFPGMTVIRGKILFYLTTSNWYIMRYNIINCSGEYLKYLHDVVELSKIKDESQTILHLEPSESIENAMGSALNNIDLFRSKYASNLLKQEILKSRNNS